MKTNDHPDHDYLREKAREHLTLAMDALTSLEQHCDENNTISHYKVPFRIDMDKDDFGKLFFLLFGLDDFNESMGVDDCIGIFKEVLKGGSDLTADLLNEIASDYGVTNLIITETKEKMK